MLRIFITSGILLAVINSYANGQIFPESQFLGYPKDAPSQQSGYPREEPSNPLEYPVKLGYPVEAPSNPLVYPVKTTPRPTTPRPTTPRPTTPRPTTAKLVGYEYKAPSNPLEYPVKTTRKPIPTTTVRTTTTPRPTTPRATTPRATTPRPTTPRPTTKVSGYEYKAPSNPLVIISPVETTPKPFRTTPRTTTTRRPTTPRPTTPRPTTKVSGYEYKAPSNPLVIISPVKTTPKPFKTTPRTTTTPRPTTPRITTPRPTTPRPTTKVSGYEYKAPSNPLVIISPVETTPKPFRTTPRTTTTPRPTTPRPTTPRPTTPRPTPKVTGYEYKAPSNPLVIVSPVEKSQGYPRIIPENRLIYNSISENLIGSSSIQQLYVSPVGDGSKLIAQAASLPKSEDEEDGRYHADEDHTHWDIRKSIPGEPGSDYPVLDEIPATKFACDEYRQGYYADIETGCQVFHICTQDSRSQKKSFLCPNGTIFNQELLICDWWANVDCAASETYYTRNTEVGRQPSGLSPVIMMRLPPKLVQSEGSQLGSSLYRVPSASQSSSASLALQEKEVYLPPQNSNPVPSLYQPPSTTYLPPVEVQSERQPSTTYLPPIESHSEFQGPSTSAPHVVVHQEEQYSAAFSPPNIQQQSNDYVPPVDSYSSGIPSPAVAQHEFKQPSTTFLPPVESEVHLENEHITISPPVNHQEYHHSTIAPPVVHQEYQPIEPPVVHQEYQHSTFAPPVVHQEHQSVAPPVVHQEYQPVAPPVVHQEYQPIEPPVVHQEYQHSTFAPPVVHQEYQHSTVAPPVVHQEYQHSTVAPPVVHQEYQHSTVSPPVVHQEYQHSTSHVDPVETYSQYQNPSTINPPLNTQNEYKQPSTTFLPPIESESHIEYQNPTASPPKQSYSEHQHSSSFIPPTETHIENHQSTQTKTDDTQEYQQPSTTFLPPIEINLNPEQPENYENNHSSQYELSVNSEYPTEDTQIKHQSNADHEANQHHISDEFNSNIQSPTPNEDYSSQYVEQTDNLSFQSVSSEQPVPEVEITQRPPNKKPSSNSVFVQVKYQPKQYNVVIPEVEDPYVSSKQENEHRQQEVEKSILKSPEPHSQTTVNVPAPVEDTNIQYQSQAFDSDVGQDNPFIGVRISETPVYHIPTGNEKQKDQNLRVNLLVPRKPSNPIGVQPQYQSQLNGPDSSDVQSYQKLVYTPELVRSIEFSLDTEEGRQQLQQAVVNGLFSDTAPGFPVPNVDASSYNFNTAQSSGSGSTSAPGKTHEHLDLNNHAR